MKISTAEGIFLTLDQEKSIEQEVTHSFLSRFDFKKTGWAGFPRGFVVLYKFCLEFFAVFSLRSRPLSDII
jgi:hypothetical protein